MKRVMKKVLCYLAAVVMVIASVPYAQAACSDGEPRPHVIATDPVSDAVGVALNKVIRITFDIDMDDDTIRRDSNHDGFPDYILVRNTSTGNDIPGTVTYDPSGGGIGIFTPAANLQPNTRYRVKVLDNVKADNDCRMSDDYTFYFTTGAAAGDTTPPTIIAVSPAHNSTGNPVATTLTINFSEAMDAATITTNNITLVDNAGNPVAGNVAYIAASRAATFTPLVNLSPNMIYRATVRTPQVKDVIGNGLDVSNSPINTASVSYQWTFTTVITDATRPTVVSVLPLNNATGVAVNTTVTANFSEALAPATVNGDTFTLKAGAVAVAGAVTYDAALDQAIFTPAGPLANSTTYTATLTTVITDIAGNHLLSNYTWVFTTAAVTVAADMVNYCQTPPFITTGSRVKPNVLLIVDNSGSMSEFAYKASGKGDSTWDDSYDSAAEYYGYFDTKHMYKYTETSGGFFELDTTKTLDNTSFWSGNFLNWLTMRRVDVVRKVLVGGKTSPRSANTANYLIGYEDADRDHLKSYASKYYEIDRGSSYGQIGVCSTSNCNSYTKTYNIKVYVGNNPPDEGIIIKMSDLIRFGIMFFNDGYRYENDQNSVRDGGEVGVDIGSTGVNLVTQVENTDPSTWTPLAEALYESTRYFQAASSAYNGGTYSGKDPIEYPCQKNFVLLLTDGESTKDRNLPGTAFTGGSYGTVVSDITGGNFNIKTWMDRIAANEGYASSQWNTSANSDGGSYYLEGVAYYSHMTDFRSSTLGATNIGSTQNLTLYTVFAFDDSSVGRDLLRKAAKYGGFADQDNDGKPFTDATCGTATPNAKCSEWDKDRDGIPDTYFEARQGGAVGDAIQRALNDILAHVASGTATSILSSSEGSGATILQAIFYPKKVYSSGSEVGWIGEMQNMWYYLDPRLNNSRVREDAASPFSLNLVDDYIVESRYDPTDSTTKVDRFLDSDGNGSADSGTPFDTISLDTLKSLWRAGQKLFTRDVAVSGNERTIYTTLDGSSLTDFRALDITDSSIRTLLQAGNTAEATKTINYIHGIDQTGYRSRSVRVCSNDNLRQCSTDSSCTAPGTCVAKVWKLGDIVSSSPKVQSKFPLNKYHTAYGDVTYSNFVGSSNYTGRGTVYVGANDGMLHAVKFGTLDQTLTAGTTKAKLCQDDNSDGLCGSGETTTANLGKEEWAFIPKNTLPYLKYLSDPDYCHIYSIDLTPTLVDASIGDTDCTPDPSTSLDQTGYWDCSKKRSDGTAYGIERWRTILIGGMRLGGGCKDPSYTGSNGIKVPLGVCSNDSTRSCVTNADCANPGTCTGATGYSSYFALDITNPSSPTLLWEFVPTAHNLGLTTTGPSIVRINARNKSGSASIANKDKNGRWFAVFASGPTGPIDTIYGQFKGFSDQQLKLFVLDLKTGALLRTIDTFADASSTPFPSNAFGGALYNGNIDLDRDYQDDVVYMGYTKSEDAVPSGTTKWNQGGVLRIVTQEDLNSDALNSTALNPANWKATPVIDNIGPVTSSIGHLAHYPRNQRTPDQEYLYFGTGRYFYTIPDASDDTVAQRRIFGIKEPCLANILGGTACGGTETATFASLVEAADEAGTTNSAGWYINLSPAAGSLFSERVITDPLAAPNGAVFFTSFAPSTDVCAFGGKSYLWAVKYDTGGAVSGYLKGKGLLQLSTGAIEEIELKKAFGKSDGVNKDADFSTTHREGKRTDAMEGVPPTGQGLSIVVPPKPINRILHINKK